MSFSERLKKVNCTFSNHKWFTEFDSSGLPLFRICYRCSKFQQPMYLYHAFLWKDLKPGTISYKVLKSRANILNRNQ